MDSSRSGGRPLSDGEVRRILARATELDGNGDTKLTESDVRDIARDVQISAAAIEQALAEASVSTPRTPACMPVAITAGYDESTRGRAVAPVPTGKWKRRIGSVALVAAGASAGPIALAADPSGLGPEASLLALGGTAVVGIWRALRNRQDGSLARYEEELALLMAGTTASFGVLHGGDAVQVGLIWWLILAVVGAGIVELTRRPASRAHEAELR